MGPWRNWKRIRLLSGKVMGSTPSGPTYLFFSGLTRSLAPLPVRLLLAGRRAVPGILSDPTRKVFRVFSIPRLGNEAKTAATMSLGLSLLLSPYSLPPAVHLRIEPTPR
jgi:hypothetical protein